MAEGREGVCKLEFHRSACKAFPTLLDFVYGTNPNLERSETLAATTASATALLFLGDRLGCPAIFEAALSFIKRDMQIPTACTYLSYVYLPPLPNIRT